MFQVTVTVKSKTKELLIKAFLYAASHVKIQNGNLHDYKSCDTGGNEWSVIYGVKPRVNIFESKEEWERYKAMNEAKFKHWQLVQKTKGYRFDGVIVSVFQNTLGEWRYVVEHSWLVGLLHIFNEDQLAERTDFKDTMFRGRDLSDLESELKHYRASYETLVKSAPPKIRELESKNEELKAKIRSLEASRAEIKRLLDDASVELEGE